MRQRISAVLRGGLAQFLILFLAMFGLGVSATHAQMGPIKEIQLAPLATAVTSDDTVPFTVHALDEAGTVEDVTSKAVFSENDPFGAFSDNVYFPGKIGTWDVQATYDGFAAQTTVTVTEGALGEIIINPNTNPEVVDLGTKREFTAQGYDADNNVIGNLTPTWAVQGDAGTIDTKGVFAAVKEGAATVTATIGSVSAAVRVEVKDIADEVPPANTNVNANANSNVNAANGNANTNQSGAVLGEETQDENVNTGEGTEATTEEVTADNTNTAAATEETSSCTTYDWWIWLLGIVVYLSLLGAYYYLVRTRSDMMIWIAPAILTALGLWAFFALTCAGSFLWVPWVMVIGGLLVTLFRPREFQPLNGKTL